MYRYIIETNSLTSMYESRDKAMARLNGLILAGVKDVFLFEENWDGSKEFEFTPKETKVIYAQGELKIESEDSND